MRAFLSLLMLCLSCATAKPAPAPTETTAVAPVAEKDDLASAFDSPAEVAARAPTLPDDSAGKFRTALQDTRELLDSKHAPEALARAEDALALAEKLWSADRAAAHDLHFKALVSVDPGRAFDDAQKWFDHCGPDDVAVCRLAAATAMNQAAGLKGATKEQKTLAAKGLKSEKCLAAGEKSGRAEACLKEAEQGDVVNRARGLLIRALAEKNPAKKLAGLNNVVALKEPKAAGVRLQALEAVAQQKVADQDLEAAVRALLEGNQGLLMAVDSTLRRWVRSPALDAVCVTFDQKNGPGACRALEKKTLGQHTFRDFSRQLLGEGLPPDQVKLVNEHYGPLLQECLAQQAKRMAPPSSQTFDVKWMVLNDGRVTEAHLRSDLDWGPFAQCVRGQFAWWRYPRYEGEFQHVQQSFTVTAAQRK